MHSYNLRNQLLLTIVVPNPLFVIFCLHSSKDLLMHAFQEHQGHKAFSLNLAHFVNHPTCHGRDLPAASPGTHCILSCVVLLF